MISQLTSAVPNQANSSPASSSPTPKSSAILNDNQRLMQLMKPYHADQQVKYLHLEAEIEVLLQQLKTAAQHQKLQACAAKADDN
jgi:hypothetical protein